VKCRPQRLQRKRCLPSCVVPSLVPLSELHRGHAIDNVLLHSAYPAPTLLQENRCASASPRTASFTVPAGTSTSTVFAPASRPRGRRLAISASSMCRLIVDGKSPCRTKYTLGSLHGRLHAVTRGALQPRGRPVEATIEAFWRNSAHARRRTSIVSRLVRDCHDVL
jgi:hypothetical protein